MPNHQINKKLEEIAQSIFKQWITNFNFPDENGTPHKDSGGAMIDSELGKIPKGWSVVELGNIITLNKGKSYKSSELANSGLPMVNLKCFGRNYEFRHDGIKYFVGQYKDTHLVKGNDLVISMTDVTQQAEIIANVLMIPNYLSKAIISLDVSSINSINEEVSNSFLYYLLKTNMFRDFAKGYASGTTVLHLNKNGILNYKFVLPDSNTLKQISCILKDVITQKDTNIAQNAVMTNIRDSLLPKLMSGEIDVTHGV
ncbi:MAG: restriction endonuclease subunit S [Bacteroidia bacterium]|nr:MAG: restriction endonuclease subunit S [Bacteroidia bacterium]